MLSRVPAGALAISLVMGLWAPPVLAASATAQAPHRAAETSAFSLARSAVRPEEGTSTPPGTLSVVAGKGPLDLGPGPATNAELNQPENVAVDARGDLFIADYGNDTVDEVTSDGRLFVVAGDADQV